MKNMLYKAKGALALTLAVRSVCLCLRLRLFLRRSRACR